MRHHKGFIRNQLRSELFYQFWVPDNHPQALILIIHGLTGHSGRYSKFVDYFTQKGYAIFGIDLPGHGRSSGEKAFIKSFKTYINTIDDSVQRIKRLYPQKPLFILGHSMGGLIATEYLTQKNCKADGAILSCPSIKTTKPLSKVKYLFSLFCSVFAPKIHIQKLHTQNCKSLCNSSDPFLYKGKITARLSIELIKAMKRVILKAPKISTPMLILQCTEDSLVSPEGAKSLYSLINSKDKTLKLYNSQSHEILSSTNNNTVINDLSWWLTEHSNRFSV